MTTPATVPSRAPQSPPRPVLTVDGLTVRAGATVLVDDVDLQIRRGERVGLIGESGSGKTLTALAIMGLLAEDLAASGSVHLDQVDHELLGAAERWLADVRGNRIGMVFQEPMTALNPSMRIGKQVAEVMTIHGRDDDRAARAAIDLLGQVRLPDPAGIARAYPHQLSGGQRQRVVLAIALANDPALLICDEPSTALDVTVQAQVLDLIVSGVEARDSALLFISHDLAVVATVCERVLVMYGGRVVEAGSVRAVLTAPRHPYTQGLLAASDLDQVDERGRLLTIAGTVPPAGQFPSGCVFRNRCPRATPECAEVPPWTGSGPDAGYACFHPHAEVALPDLSGRIGLSERVDLGRSSGSGNLREVGDSAGSASDLIIAVGGVSRTYRRPRRSLRRPGAAIQALRGIDLDVRAGERFGIVGESGSGKSTLLRLLAGVDQPTAGGIEVLGQPIVGRRERDLRFLRESLQLVFQDPSGSLDPRMRVRDIVAEPLVAQGHRKPYDRVRELLDAVGLSAASADRYPHQFSGGQRQRISLARALAPDPRILVADEPVSALDVSLRGQVLNLIVDLVERFDLTLVFVSHDLAVVRHVCERVAVMHDGRFVESGTTDEVYAHPRDPYTQRLVTAVPTLQRALAGETAADLARSAGNGHPHRWTAVGGHGKA